MPILCHLVQSITSFLHIHLHSASSILLILGLHLFIIHIFVASSEPSSHALSQLTLDSIFSSYTFVASSEPSSRSSCVLTPVSLHHSSSSQPFFHGVHRQELPCLALTAWGASLDLFPSPLLSPSVSHAAKHPNNSVHHPAVPWERSTFQLQCPSSSIKLRTFLHRTLGSMSTGRSYFQCC